MNNYIKNYALWIGGSLLISFILSYVVFFPFFHYITIITGTIVGTVQTHKSEGRNIKFGKAVGPVLLFIGIFQLIGIVLSIVNNGTEYIDYWLPIVIMNSFVSLMLGIGILLAAGTWYMFEKAGKPGWASIVPIYNLIVMCEIAKKPSWWVVLFIVPIANIVFLIMMLNGISKNFGKDSGFTVGLVFLRQIFFAILGYGDAVYLSTSKIDYPDLLDN